MRIVRSRPVRFVVVSALVWAMVLAPLPLVRREAPAVRAQVIPAVYVSEIVWMGNRDDPNDEWMVLANGTSADIALRGWRLAAVDGTPAISLTGVLPAGGNYLLERTDDDSASPHSDQIYTGNLGNTGEDLRLTDAGGLEIDRAGRAGAWFSGEAGSWRSMLRRRPEVPGDQPGAWGLGAPGGTPRNSQADRDGDGFFYSPNIDWAAGGDGPEDQAEDCDDDDPAVHPDAPERLNVKDDDCDGELDEDFVLGALDYRLHLSDPDRLWAVGTSADSSAMERALIGLIDGAAVSVDAAIYELRRTRLTDALLAADSRGIGVRIVADDAQSDGEPADGLQYARLRAAGIPVKHDGRSGSLQHNKFMVVDGARVWTGSANWTDSGMTYNQENALELRSPQIAAAYAREFDEMFVAGRFSRDKLDNTPHRFRFAEGVSVEVRFAPSDGVEDAVGRALLAARQELAFAMFYWTSDRLADIVLSKSAGGMRFMGVWDAVGQKNQASEDNRFCQAGLPVKVEVFGGKVHDKLAVVDAAGDLPTVITGSTNWTAAGGEANDENTVIVRGHRPLAAAYRAEVQRLWDALPDQSLCSNHGAESGLPACADGIDNDYDDRVDLADPGCRESTVAACLDGVDNDGDGLTDKADLDCFRAPTATPALDPTATPGFPLTATPLSSPPATSTAPAAGGPFVAVLPWLFGQTP
jgi:hypothetical protein